MSHSGTQLSLVLKKESVLILSDFTMALISVVIRVITNYYSKLRGNHHILSYSEITEI